MLLLYAHGEKIYLSNWKTYIIIGFTETVVFQRFQMNGNSC